MRKRIGDIRNNPYRDLDRLPLLPAKIEALRRSYRTTGWWGNVVARPCRDDPSKVEIAYGHHRLAALQLEYGLDTEVDLIVRDDLTDETMLKIMANENLEDWTATSSAAIEIVHAVIDAYAAGDIDLPKPLPDTPGHALRYTPGGTLDACVQRPYTAVSVGKFLGWLEPETGKPQDRIGVALNALDLIDKGFLSLAEFIPLSSKAAEALVSETSRALREAEKRVREQEEEAEKARWRWEQAEQDQDRAAAERAHNAQKTAQKHAQEWQRRKVEDPQKAADAFRAVVRKKNTTIAQAKTAARDAVDRTPAKPQTLDRVAEKLMDRLYKVLNDGHPLARALDEILVNYQDALSTTKRKGIIDSLHLLAQRAEDYADSFDTTGEEVIESRTVDGEVVRHLDTIMGE